MRQSMLSPWIKGNESITPRNFLEPSDPNFEMGAFIEIGEYTDLHKVREFYSGNLESAWLKTREYIEQALGLALYSLEDADEGEDFSLDNEAKAWINIKLGEPPLASYNIYIITIYNDKEEKIVYIGKTDAKKSRFSNGHLAALKLHNPIYDDYKKRVYFGTAIFLDKNKDYLPLEYITPLEKAKELLSFTEKILINHFKPELNTQNIDIKDPISTIFHIQNFTDTTLFEGDVFIPTNI